jgi:hypothetical protein
MIRLRSERPIRGWDLDDERLDRRNVTGAWQRVVQERPGEELPGLVVSELLVERPAHTLRRAPLHLADHQRWVERPPDILGDHDADRDHLAGRGIEPDVDEMRGGRRGEALVDLGPVTLHRRMVAAEVTQFLGEITHAAASVRRPLRLDHPVDDLQIVG